MLCHAFNLLYSTQIQELFRCQKRSCSYVKGREREKLRLHRSNEEKNSVNKNNFPQILFYKYPENFELDFMLKNNKLSCRWGWLTYFSIITCALNYRALNIMKNNICTSGVRLFSSKCSHPHFSFLRNQWGKIGSLWVGFLRPVLDICFAMISVWRKHLFLVLFCYKRDD